MAARIRIGIADDHVAVRRGVQHLLTAHADLEVVGEAATAAEAEALVENLSPDVLILDLSMPGGGIPVILSCRKSNPKVRSLAFTMHDDAAMLRSVLAAGGFGYVLKSSFDAVLVSAVRDIALGRLFIDPALGRNLAVEEARAMVALSGREAEVLKLLAEGRSYQEAADRLGVSPKTVETYRARLFEKLGFKSRADLVRYALETGLVGANRDP
jgi:DNA-binding NarL/FixJ family response regulator